MFAFMPAIALTAVYALLLTGLSLAVSLRRQNLQTAFGDAGDKILQCRVRAHGNFTEYAPMSVLVVLALSATDTADLLVWAVALVFLVTRVMHAAGMMAGQTGPRALAMVVQHLTFLVAALVLVAQLLRLA
jgi:uncharacterized membrane protein YecN with MAPEG domain